MISESLYKLDVIISLKITIQTGEGEVTELTGLQEDVPNCGLILPTGKHVEHSR